MGTVRTIADDELGAAIDWLDRHCRSKHVIVAYHGDPDGVVAAAFMSDLLRSQLDCQVNGIAVRTHEFDFSRLRDQLAGASFDALVTVDINFASRPGFLPWLAHGLGRPALIYDDHLVRKQPTGPAGFRYINPTVDRTPQLPVPACFFAYLAWSGARDEHLDGSTLPDLLEIGLFGENVLSAYVRELRLLHTPSQALGVAARYVYAFYARLDWPVTEDPVFEHLGALLATSADTRAIVADLAGLDARLGGNFDRLNAAVEAGTERVLSDGERYCLGAGAELAVGHISEAEFLLTNLVASNVRNRLPCGVAMACQELPGRVIVELRRTRGLTTELDAALQQVAELAGVINSGGHPAAAGLAVTPDRLKTVLATLRYELGVR